MVRQCILLGRPTTASVYYRTVPSLTEDLELTCPDGPSVLEDPLQPLQEDDGLAVLQQLLSGEPKKGPKV